MKLSDLIEQSENLLPNHVGNYFDIDWENGEKICAACVLGRAALYLGFIPWGKPYTSPGDFLSKHLGYDLVHEIDPISKENLWNRVTVMSDFNKPVSEIVQWLRERGY